MLLIWGLVITRSGSNGGGIEQGTVSHVRSGATGDKGIWSGVRAGTIATTQGDNIRMGSTVVVEVGSVVVGLLRDRAICILHQGARWPCGHRHGHGTGGRGRRRGGASISRYAQKKSQVVRCNKIQGRRCSRVLPPYSRCMQVRTVSNRPIDRRGERN